MSGVGENDPLAARGAGGGPLPGSRLGENDPRGASGPFPGSRLDENDPLAARGASGPFPGSRLDEIGPGSLRHRAARGTITNGAYMVGINGLSIVQGVTVASLLGAQAYGLWGLITISYGTLFALAGVGFDDKYIQQDRANQQEAFEIAFTLQCILCAIFTVVAIAAIPLFVLLYGQPRILVPGMVLAVAMPLVALQTPIWVFYRRMDFARQRFLQSFQPITAFIVTVGLAVAGAGLWALVLGTLAGSIAAAAVAVLNSPYPLRFRYERWAVREYASFSWPLLANSAGGAVLFQLPITVAARSLGAAAVGAMTLASNISAYTSRVDDIVTQALYPAICAVKDRKDVLFESFSKSNRLALLWGFPAGVAAALFASDAVHFVLGRSWTLAIPLIQVLGLTAAIDQIGFNWTAYARARGETRPIALAGAAMTIVAVAAGVPLLLADGLPGFALAWGAGTLAAMAVRINYLARLFPAFKMVEHAARAIAPTLPAALLVLVGRALIDSHRTTPPRALAELTVYVAAVVLGSWIAERTLLREAVRYLRRGSRHPAAALTNV